MPNVDHSAMKLGKLSAKHDPRTLLLHHYTKDVPEPPASIDWSGKVGGDWPMMHNDTIGDCTCAAAGHMIEVWSANAASIDVPTDEDILNAYRTITGYDPADPSTDHGAIELDVLNFWRQSGIGQQKIAAFAKVGVGNTHEIKQAAWLFGGVYIGVGLPISAQRQDVWDVPPSGTGGDGAPWSWGGHAVPIVAYDDAGLTCVTWGALKRMTWSFWHAYCDEAYACLSQEWFDAQGKAPSGFDLTALQEDLTDITSQKGG